MLINSQSFHEKLLEVIIIQLSLSKESFFVVEIFFKTQFDHKYRVPYEKLR
jgi:hypothetical protein